MLKLINMIIAGAVLIICMFQDIRCGKIHIILPVAGCLAGVLINLLYGNYTIVNAVRDMSVGAGLIVYSLISKGKIGLGDGIVMLMTGIALGVHNAMLIMFFSSIASAVYMGISKKHAVPFLPAVTFTYMIACMINIMIC